MLVIKFLRTFRKESRIPEILAWKDKLAVNFTVIISVHCEHGGPQFPVSDMDCCVVGCVAS